MSKVKIRTYDEVWNIPIESYTVTDIDGLEVSINQKNPAYHSSSHPVEQLPTFFHNLGVIISDPHDIEISTSNVHKAIEARKQGVVKIYKRKNFVSELDMPGYITWKGDMTEVVVLYSNDPSKGNFTKTYFIVEEL